MLKTGTCSKTKFTQFSPQQWIETLMKALDSCSWTKSLLKACLAIHSAPMVLLAV